MALFLHYLLPPLTGVLESTDRTTAPLLVYSCKEDSVDKYGDETWLNWLRTIGSQSQFLKMVPALSKYVMHA